MKQQVLKFTDKFEKKAFWSLIFTILVLTAVYGYLVGTSIINAILREEIARDIATVSSQVSALEFEYIAKKNTINLELAYTLGFKEVTEKKFVTRRSLLVKSLTQNGESL